MTKFRIVALTGFPALTTVAACGSILDINDRELDNQTEGGAVGTDGGPNGTGDGDDISLEPAEASIPPIQNAKCADAPCIDAGGACTDGGVCAISCDKKDSCKPLVACPPGIDCEIDCAKDGACKDVTCSGGSSCTFRCRAAGACEDAKCTGLDTTCRFECNAPDNACIKSECDAKECSFVCASKHACQGVTGVAKTSCLIDCIGVQSCGGGANTCNGATSVINCTDPAKETCKGTPTCQPVQGQSCTINCTNGCPADYCCDSKVPGQGCTVKDGEPNKNCK